MICDERDAHTYVNLGQMCGWAIIYCTLARKAETDDNPRAKAPKIDNGAHCMWGGVGRV